MISREVALLILNASEDYIQSLGRDKAQALHTFEKAKTRLQSVDAKLNQALNLQTRFKRDNAEEWLDGVIIFDNVSIDSKRFQGFTIRSPHTQYLTYAIPLVDGGFNIRFNSNATNRTCLFNVELGPYTREEALRICKDYAITGQIPKPDPIVE